jgi:hypothetical protein
MMVLMSPLVGGNVAMVYLAVDLVDLLIEKWVDVDQQVDLD